MLVFKGWLPLVGHFSGGLLVYVSASSRNGKLGEYSQKCDKMLLTVIEHMCYFVTGCFKRWAMEPELIEQVEREVDLSSEEELQGNEPDLLPEYCRYRDEGCDLADSCLNCPFPQCIYEQPGGRQHWLKKGRDLEIIRLFNNEDKWVKELALMLGVSPRTVQRALKNSLSA